jgi:hypothetical protein
MRVYRNLNPLEKIVYSLTRAVLANRYSRNAFFGYCIGLHLLVVLVLYWLATAEVLLVIMQTNDSMSNILDGQLVRALLKIAFHHGNMVF